ncbi:unnamed protein product [Lampetra planeri]
MKSSRQSREEFPNNLPSNAERTVANNKYKHSTILDTTWATARKSRGSAAFPHVHAHRLWLIACVVSLVVRFGWGFPDDPLVAWRCLLKCLPVLALIPFARQRGGPAGGRCVALGLAASVVGQRDAHTPPPPRPSTY